MRDLNRRLDGLEGTLAPEGKPFMILLITHNFSPAFNRKFNTN